MSIKIWCEICFGQGKTTGENSSPRRGIKNWTKCPHCSGKGYTEKGCKNCNNHADCPNQVDRWTEEGIVGIEITFCTAWEKKDE